MVGIFLASAGQTLAAVNSWTIEKDAPDANKLKFYWNDAKATSPLTITTGDLVDPVGKVGIGTASPATRTHIVQPYTINGGTTLPDTSWGVYKKDMTLLLDTGTDRTINRGGGIGFSNKDGFVLGAIKGAATNSTLTDYGGYLGFYTTGATSGGGSNGYERMRIDQNGKVGIGTVNPAMSLDVNNTVQIKNSTGNSSIQLRGGVDGGNSSTIYMYNPAGVLKTIISDGTYTSNFNGPPSDWAIKATGISHGVYGYGSSYGVYGDSPLNRGVYGTSVTGVGGTFISSKSGCFADVGHPSYSTYGNCDTYTTKNSYAAGYPGASSKTLKENFQTINTQEILDKISNLPVMKWNYKKDDPSIMHIGPFSEDFHSAFGLAGTDDKTINLIDEAGIALAGEKALIEKNKELERRITELEEKINTLLSK